MNKIPEPYRSTILDELLAQITPKEQEKVAIKMRVAVRIADLLDERSMQKKQLAELCGLKGASMVTKWLSGGHNFTLDTLVDIASALDTSVADLVRSAENKVVSMRTWSVFVAAPPAPPRTTLAAHGELVGRASASESTGPSNSMVSEPVSHYGKPQTCYA